MENEAERDGKLRFNVSSICFEDIDMTVLVENKDMDQDAKLKYLYNIQEKLPQA